MVSLMMRSCSANLNKSYFTDRQDRYLHFRSTSLSDYCFSFLRAMDRYSFKLISEIVGSYSLVWLNTSIHHETIEIPAGNSLRSFQTTQKLASETVLSTDNVQGADSVLIFPVIQAGQFGIREEERCMDLLFGSLDKYASSSKDTPLVDLTSGYFGLYEPYQKLVQESAVNCRILCASPRVRVHDIC